MPLNFGLAEPLRPLAELPAAMQAQYDLMKLLDAFFTQGNFKPITQFGPHRNVQGVELIPSNQEGYILKAEIDTVVSIVTAAFRHGTAAPDYHVLSDANYHLRVTKISFDEWLVNINTRHGTLSCRFIEA